MVRVRTSAMSCLMSGRGSTPIEEWCRGLSSLRGSLEPRKLCRDSPGESTVREARRAGSPAEPPWYRDAGSNKRSLKYHPGFMHRTRGELDGWSISMGPSTKVERSKQLCDELNGYGGNSQDFARVADWKLSSEYKAWVRLCEKGDLSGALQALDCMSRQGIFVSRAMLYRILKECIAKKDLVVGRLVHALSARLGYELNSFISNHLIRLYATSGSLAEANQVFSKLFMPTASVFASIVTAHVKHGQAKEAIHIYGQMRQLAVKPDAYVFVAALKACATAGDLTSGKLVHGDVLDCGLELNMYIGSSLVDMYAKCGCLEDARKIFDRLPSKDVVTWSAMINGYAQCGLGQDVLLLYERMQLEGVSPANDVTYVSILKSCGRLGAIQEGRRIHSHILARQIEPDTYVGNSLVDMYARCGSMKDAREVFDRLLTRDVVTWNTIISGYAHEGLNQDALDLYVKMQQNDVTPDNVTYVTILKVCASMGGCTEGKIVHSQLLARGVELDVFVGSALVDMYAKCASLHNARSVFDKLCFKNLVTWNVMIGAYAEHGLGQEAVKLFASMQCAGLKPDKITATHILKACGNSGALLEGRKIHAQIMGGGVEAIVGNSLVDMYAKCGSMEEALGAFERVSARDVVAWNALMNGYSQKNDYKMVMQCLRDMQQQGVEPDPATYTSILVACSHVGLVDEGQQHFKTMVHEHGLKPTVQHYNCMVDLLGRAGQVSEAEKILCSIPLEAHIVGWRSLLSACKTFKNVDIGRRCFDSLIQMEPQHSASYVLMASIYRDAGRLEDAKEIESLRKCVGSEKQPAKASVEVNKKVYEFIVGEKRDDTSAKLESLNSTMETEGLMSCTNYVLKPSVENRQDDALCGHAEKLALAFGLLNTPANTCLLVVKNLRMCNDCHNSTKVISRVERRDIIVKDEHRVHHFKDGLCSCGDSC